MNHASRVVIIYALCDPVSGERRYIGKANDLAARLREHRWEAKSSSLHTRKVNWLRSLCGDPKVEILEVCTKGTWQEAERRWIAETRAENDRLTNFAPGGQTSPVEGRRHSEESKSRMRDAALRRGAVPPSQKGAVPWNKGLKGSLKRNKTSFFAGQVAWNKGVQATHCPAGHPYSPENTRIEFRASEQRYFQSCLTCKRMHKIERRRLRRAA